LTGESGYAYRLIEATSLLSLKDVTPPSNELILSEVLFVRSLNRVRLDLVSEFLSFASIKYEAY